jgi:hypothetical protein
MESCTAHTGGSAVDGPAVGRAALEVDRLLHHDGGGLARVHAAHVGVADEVADLVVDEVLAVLRDVAAGLEEGLDRRREPVGVEDRATVAAARVDPADVAPSTGRPSSTSTRTW